MNNQNIFIKILGLFSPESIYAQLDFAVTIYWTTIVPALIILGVAVRYLELMQENLGQGARWSDAIKDIKSAIIFTSLYAAFGAVAIEFHQVFCNMLNKHGSIKTILGSYEQFLSALKSQPEAENAAGAMLDKMKAVVNQYSVQAVVAQTLCFLSMILLALINVLLRIIYALGFCILYLWGMFAVPTLSTKHLKLTSGWSRGFITLALWPIIEATVYMLIGPMFESWVAAAEGFGSGAQEFVNLALIYTFANLVLMAVSVSAFAMAVVIGSNQNLVAGLGTSFLAAWGAGASLTMNATRLFKPKMPATSMGGAASPGAGGAGSGTSPSVDGLNSGGGSSQSSSSPSTPGVTSPGGTAENPVQAGAGSQSAAGGLTAEGGSQSGGNGGAGGADAIVNQTTNASGVHNVGNQNPSSGTMANRLNPTGNATTPAGAGATAQGSAGATSRPASGTAGLNDLKR